MTMISQKNELSNISWKLYVMYSKEEAKLDQYSGGSSEVLNNGGFGSKSDSSIQKLPENCPAVSIANKQNEKRRVSYGDPESVLRRKAMSFKNIPSIIRKRRSLSCQKASIISPAAADTNHGGDGDDFPTPDDKNKITGDGSDDCGHAHRRLRLG
nr:transcription factor MYB3R-2-like [Ipomoea batatas]